MSEIYQNKINYVKAFQWNGTAQQLKNHGFDQASFNIQTIFDQSRIVIDNEIGEQPLIGRINDWIVNTPYDGNRIFTPEEFEQRYRKAHLNN